jgi:hypothetical protein
MSSFHSRIRLETLAAQAHPDREVFVGWDRPVGTYYVQVFDGCDQDGEDVVLLDRGGILDRITDPAAAIDVVRPYAVIPEDLPATLTRHRVDAEAEAETRGGAAGTAGMSMRIDPYDLHRALHRAATEHLNTLGQQHGLPPMSWHVHVDDHRVSVHGYAAAYDLDDPRAAAEQWAAALELREAPDLDDGSRAFTTDRPDSPVREVWYIADQPRWDAVAEANSQRWNTAAESVEATTPRPEMQA